MAIPLRGLHRSAGASGAGAWSAGSAGCASAAAALLPGKALENYWILWIFHNLPLLSLFLLEITIFNGKTHYKWPFSIAMLNYQRVDQLLLLPVADFRDLVSDFRPCEWQTVGPQPKSRPWNSKTGPAQPSGHMDSTEERSQAVGKLKIEFTASLSLRSNHSSSN